MTDILQISSQPEQSSWDEYISGNNTAIYSHLYDWGEILALSYRLAIFRLVVSNKAENGKISGILPLILFDAPDREKRLISLPYTDAAGIVADGPESRDQLLVAALELANKVGAAHVELRQAGNCAHCAHCAFRNPTQDLNDCWDHTAHSFKTGLLRPLPESPAVLWSQLPAKVRNQVRKARKCACVVKIGGKELFDAFFAVFSENMRDLGSPVHDPELFRRLLGNSSLKARVLVVSIGSQPVAAAIVFRHNDTLFNPWASSLRGWRPFCPNTLLYWAMLEHGIETGCRWFDFGRSSPTASTFRFKRGWGAEMQPLVWHVFSRKPSVWNPHSESLVCQSWKTRELQSSRRDGPAIRRWISL